MITLIMNKLDFFKTPFFLRTNKFEKTSTEIGFFFSLGIICFLSVFFFNSDIFYHKRPNTLDQSIQLIKKENINLNQDNFGIVWAVTDGKGLVYKDDTVFSLVFDQMTLDATTKEYTEYSTKEFHPCTPSDFKSDSTVYDINGFDNYSCLTNHSLNLNGGYDESFISYFGFTITLCDNSTSNFSCQSPENIFEAFKDKYLSIYFKETNYELNNYEEPINSKYKNLYWSISPNMRKSINISFKKLEILTDDGFFFENQNLIEGYKQDIVDIDFDLNFNNYLLGVYFISSSNKQYASRNYQKIQEVIAGIGGIFSFLSSIGFIFTYHQNYLSRINNIMNQLYAFPKFESPRRFSKNSLKKKKREKNVKIKPFQFKKNKKNISHLKFQCPPQVNQVNHLNKFNFISQDEIKHSSFNSESNENNINSNLSITHSDNEYVEKIEKNFYEYKKNTTSKELIEIQSHKSEPVINENKNSNKKKNLSLFSRIIKKTKDKKKIKNLHNEITKSERFSFSILDFSILMIKRIFKYQLNIKELLFLKTEKNYLREIDLVSILKRIHEIDKIKLLLFNERQLSLINLLSKPMNYIKNNKFDSHQNSEIDINRPSIRMTSIIKESYRKVNSEKLLENYEETIKCINKNEIDMKLIRFLDEKANELIKK